MLRKIHPVYGGLDRQDQITSLWITREKLWINRFNWGETLSACLYHPPQYPYLWGMFSDTPHRSHLPVGWGKRAGFVKVFPSHPCGENLSQQHPGMGFQIRFTPISPAVQSHTTLSPHIHSSYYYDYIDTNHIRELFSTPQTQR